MGSEQLIDFMTKELIPYRYNNAIEDARQQMNEKMSQIEMKSAQTLIGPKSRHPTRLS
ncbi:DUF2164 family protein [Paenibacillus sp. N3.4]|uniref:DUF2164 family protein n=1 Tax=Paenibacillus sp. N3.4 TaxID=2603222 RepID=UPI0011C70B39|nr:DUF2164 domain-containing protein [Paenibacillus sp. N3.4]